MEQKIIEKHVIIDKSVNCPDQEVSIDFDQLKELIDAIKKIELSLGSKKIIHKNEEIIRSWAHRSIVTIKKIKKGIFYQTIIFGQKDLVQAYQLKILKI